MGVGRLDGDSCEDSDSSSWMEDDDIDGDRSLGLGSEGLADEVEGEGMRGLFLVQLGDGDLCM